MNKSFNVLDAIQRPHEVSSPEYQAIFECIEQEIGFDNPQEAMDMCEEFKAHAQMIIDRLEAAILAQH